MERKIYYIFEYYRHVKHYCEFSDCDKLADYETDGAFSCINHTGQMLQTLIDTDKAE